MCRDDAVRRDEVGQSGRLSRPSLDNAARFCRVNTQQSPQAFLSLRFSSCTCVICSLYPVSHRRLRFHLIPKIERQSIIAPPSHHGSCHQRHQQHPGEAQSGRFGQPGHSRQGAHRGAVQRAQVQVRESRTGASLCTSAFIHPGRAPCSLPIYHRPVKLKY